MDIDGLAPEEDTRPPLVALAESYAALQLDFDAEAQGGAAWKTAMEAWDAHKAQLATLQEAAFRNALDIDALQRALSVMQATADDVDVALPRARTRMLQLGANTTRWMQHATEAELAQRPPGHTLTPPHVPVILQVDVRNPALGHAASYATAMDVGVELGDQFLQSLF